MRTVLTGFPGSFGRVVGIATFGLVLLGSQAAAAPSALQVGPAETPFALAMTNVGALENHVAALESYLAVMKLHDPGFAELEALLREATGLAVAKKRSAPGKLAREFGLNPQGAIVLYAVPVKGRLRAVVAADVSDGKLLLKSLQRIVESMRWKHGDGKGPRIHVQMSEGGRRASVMADDSARLHVRLEAGIVAFSSENGAVDQLQLSGGNPLGSVMAKLPKSADALGGALYVDTAAYMKYERHAPSWFEDVTRIEAAGSIGKHGLTGWAQVQHGEDIEDFVKAALPNPASGATRQVMAGIAGGGSGDWFRYSFNPQVAFGLMEAMLGPAITDMVGEVKREIGVDLKKDIVGNLTGDVLVVTRETLADGVLVVGVKDSKKAAKSLSKMLSKSFASGDHRYVKTGFVKEKGGDLYKTQVWWGDKKRKEIHGETVLWWGARSGALVFGLSPHHVKAALAIDVAKKAGALPPLLVQGAFGDKDIFALHARFGELAPLLRQILPPARSLWSKETPQGRAARVTDTLTAVYDRLVDLSAIGRYDGRTITIELEARALPTTGSAGYSAGAEQAYEEALKARYQGLVRSSNEALLALAKQFPGTPYANKALQYALGGGAFSAASQSLWLGVMFFGLGY